MDKRNNVRMVFMVLAVLVTMSACESLSSLTIGFESGGSSTGFHGDPPGRLPAPYRIVGTFQNNASVHLDSGTFHGNFTIDANQVTLTGRGTRQTIIDGDVRIDGNGCVIRQLRIRGDVYIRGNNADLNGAVIEGRVFSSGQNNRWPHALRPTSRK
jgi:hypothetical protein